MDIKTTFSCGDKAWVFFDYPKLVTIGQVRVEITDSPGVEQGGIEFDNYKAQSERREQYMCVETGIGSGTLWEVGKSIFQTKEECVAANAERIERQEQQAREAREREQRQLLLKEESLRAQLAQIEAIKAEQAA